MQHSMPTSHAVEGSLSEFVRLLLLYVCQCAVPLFFVISGYLFFINIQSFSFQTYKKKFISRIKSILIPYLIWNALYILFHTIQSFAFPAQMAALGKTVIQEFTIMDYLSCFWRNSVMGAGNEYFPINIPLWYLRDLFVMCLITPAIWLLLKYLKQWFVVILAAIYLFADWKGLCTGLSINGLLFFVVGSYFGFLKVKEFRLSVCYIISVPVFALLLVTCVFFANTEILHHLLILIGCIAIVTIFTASNKMERFEAYSSCSMMIYVMQVFWLSLFNQIYMHIIGLDSDFSRILSYFTLCALTVISSIIITKIGRKTIPNAMRVLGYR